MIQHADLLALDLRRAIRETKTRKDLRARVIEIIAGLDAQAPATVPCPAPRFDFDVDWCPDADASPETQPESAPAVDSETEIGREYGGG